MVSHPGLHSKHFAQIISFSHHIYFTTDFPGSSVGKDSVVWETRARSLGWEDPLEKEMATDYSIHAWKIPWTEEPGGLQSMEL